MAGRPRGFSVPDFGESPRLASLQIVDAQGTAPAVRKTLLTAAPAPRENAKMDDALGSTVYAGPKTYPIASTPRRPARRSR